MLSEMIHGSLSSRKLTKEQNTGLLFGIVPADDEESGLHVDHGKSVSELTEEQGGPSEHAPARSVRRFGKSPLQKVEGVK
jgi:hypothetical protein